MTKEQVATELVARIASIRQSRPGEDLVTPQ